MDPSSEYGTISSPSPVVRVDPDAHVEKRRKLELPTLPISRHKEPKHREMDVEVNKIVIKLKIHDDTLGLAYLLTKVVETCKTMDQQYTNTSTVQDLIEKESALSSMLRDALNQRSYKKLRDILILQAPSHGYVDQTGLMENRQVAEESIRKSWGMPYKSGPETAFMRVLKNYYENSTEDEDYYAPYVPIVQSSGTGKSRMVHEISGHICTVVINLREPGTTGYPPHDQKVRDYFAANIPSQEMAYNKCYIFCVALFEEVKKLLLSDSGPRSASDLRSYLAYGNPDFEDQRSKFFSRVIKSIDGMKVVQEKEPAPGGQNQSQFPPTKIQRTENGKILEDALDESFRSLQAAIEGLPTPASDSDRHPIRFLLALDEAHVLTPVKTGGFGPDWSVFGELRRVIRRLRAYPFYAVFLSTTGSIRQFRPNVRDDTSKRLYTGQLLLRLPYVQTGFDLLTIPVKNGEHKLDDVTTPKRWAFYGRPLWGSRFHNNPDFESLIGFAVQKLMDGTKVKEATWKDALLAPLAIRLPLEFNTSTFAGRRLAGEHVERHMRLCLGILPDSDIMVTTNPSEPVLAEAAARLMEQFNPAQELNCFWNDTRVSKGDRGELGTCLLILMAHDNLIRSFPPPRVYNQPVRLLDLLDHLLATKIEHVEFRKTFKDSWAHVTHFVKVMDKDVINVKYLWRMMLRGAAILCVDGQKAYDYMFPFTIKGKTVSEANSSIFCGQGKNAVEYTNHKVKPSKLAFQKMDPIEMKLFGEGKRPFVINAINALAATKASVNVTKNAKNRSYNIFIGGSSHLTYKPIKQENDDIWKSIFSRSGVEEIYGGDEMVADITMTMCPGARANDAHWSSFVTD